MASEPNTVSRPRAILWSAIAYLIDRFSIDARTLALFRILAGLIIIGDILARIGRFTFFYTEDGVVPQSLAEARSAEYAFSIFYYTTNTWVIAALFVVHAIFAVQLMIGYRTTFATVVSFIFVISLDHHNPLILSYADTLFRLILFWAIFLPLGERWSVDAVLRERPPRVKINNLASAAILLQMIYMYLANGLHKSTNELWTSGIATPLIFGLDDMTYFLAEPLRQFPGMLEIGGLTWYYMLLLSPILLILPSRLRALLVGAFVIAHLSFAITVRIGGFGYVALAGVTLFLQTGFWEDLRAIARRFSLDQSRIAGHARSSRERMIRWAGAFPRFPDSSLVPLHVREGIHAAVVTVAMIFILIIPPLAVAQEHGYVDYDFIELERESSSYTRAIGVRQPPWTVFAPNPRTVDRYYVFPALTADGDLLDVYWGRPLTFERPERSLQRQYSNYRERFYMNSVRRDGARSQQIPRLLAEYLCRTWLEDRGIELTHINMWTINERITLDTIDDPENRQRWSDSIYQHGCGDHAPQDLPEPSF